jgi:hypothetical protein
MQTGIRDRENPLGSAHFKVRVFDWDPIREYIMASSLTAAQTGQMTTPDLPDAVPTQSGHWLSLQQATSNTLV